MRPKTRIILAAASCLLTLAVLIPSLSVAADAKPRFDYRRGVAIEETALCYAKLNYKQPVCAQRCAKTYSADTVKTRDQGVLIRMFAENPIRNNYSQVAQAMTDELYRDLGVHLEALKKKAAALQERMGQTGYVAIPEDARLLKDYQDEIDELRTRIEEQVAIRVMKTRDDLIALLVKYVRDESGSYIPKGYVQPNYQSLLLAKPDTGLMSALKQKFGDFFSPQQKDEHGFVVNQKIDLSGDYLGLDAETHQQADLKKRTDCETVCAADREAGLPVCQQDFERLRKAKCDADYALGVRYCNTIPQEQYKACNDEYVRLHGQCYEAPGIYQADFRYPDLDKVPPEMRSFMDTEAATDKAIGLKLDAEWQSLKNELDAKRANATQKIEDWLRAWKDGRAAQAGADQKEKVLDRTSDEILQKELERKRRAARQKENEKEVKRIDDTLRDKKRSQLVKNADKNARPILADYATAKKIADEAKKEGLIPKSPTEPDKSKVSVSGTVFDIAFNTLLDVANIFPSLKPYSEAARGTYIAGGSAYGDITSGSDNPKLSAGANQQIERGQKIAARLGGGAVIQTFGGLVHEIGGGLPGTGLITPGFITDKIYEDLGKVGEKVQNQWTEDADEAAKSALSRPGSPGLTFANRWAGNAGTNTMTFEPKDRSGEPVKGADGKPLVVDFSRSANWRQFGSDDAPTVYLTPVDDYGVPNTSFYLRLRPSDHKVELIKKESLLEPDGRTSNEAWSVGEWNY
ncbi:hypothetical protein A3C96_02625 [Candidatus Uhrbacteria bacterium RIFCSPHIGHO2_02_FULL_60_10]|uniref:Uncharacterized protein n=1 Tax=Candidatus Uhrbacteria bacterium RIFCSPHIGHO2_02_FULL_60_10 TaxID=1802392 RepID=A0A1F7U2T5_9BACT|nr:MAG: hypothetical protein A3C96_02625 [Candidatus Uhrbacteria bacterium RIFCSPHIGHO2_02_FULL_60_10]